MTEARKRGIFGAQLISFPELYVEGYTMTPDMMHHLAEPVTGPSISLVREIAEENHIGIICPYAEKDDSSGETRFYDAIAFVGADGSLLHNYRKTHLFGLAERNNYAFGYTDNKDEAFKVGDVNGLKVGVLNCYEAEFDGGYEYKDPPDRSTDL